MTNFIYSRVVSYFLPDVYIHQKTQLYFAECKMFVCFLVDSGEAQGRGADNKLEFMLTF